MRSLLGALLADSLRLHGPVAACVCEAAARSSPHVGALVRALSSRASGGTSEWQAPPRRTKREFWDTFRFERDAMPELEEHLIRGTVVAATRRRIYVETGLAGMFRMRRKEVKQDLVVEPRFNEDGDFEVYAGDEIDFVVPYLNGLDGNPLMRAINQSNPPLPILTDVEVAEMLDVARRENLPVNGTIIQATNQHLVVGFGARVKGTMPTRYMAAVPEEKRKPGTSIKCTVETVLKDSRGLLEGMILKSWQSEAESSSPQEQPKGDARAIDEGTPHIEAAKSD